MVDRRRRWGPVGLALAGAASVAVLRGASTKMATTSLAGRYHTATFGSGHSQTTKATWPASDPVAVASFMLGYLPTTPWLVGNESWVDGGCATWGKVILGNHTDSAFQIHAVSAPRRPDGGFAVADAEAVFAAAAQAALAAPGGSPPAAVLEAHAALYADDLDAFVDRFRCGAVAFRSVESPGGARGGKTYSLFVHVPDSLVVLEIASTSPSTKAPAEETWPLPRYSQALPPPNHVRGAKFRGLPALTAFKISYATDDVDAATAFYVDVLGADVALDAAAGGSRVVMLRFPSDDATRVVEVHHVSHPISGPTTRLASLKNAAHAAAGTETETEGFDQWMDGHIGHRLGRSNVLDGFLDRARAAGTRHLVFTDYAASSDSWTDYLYVVAPDGHAVQIVGNLTASKPADVRAFDTCEASGGALITNKAAFEAREADKNYQLHPNYEAEAKRIEASYAWLEACAGS